MLHSVESNFNSAFLRDLKISVFNNSAGVSCFNLSVTQKVDLKRIIITFEVKKPLEPGKSTIVFQSNIDTCNVAKGTIGNFFMKILLKDHEKFSNYRYERPSKKGFYYWYSFPLPQDAVLPSFLPKVYMHWELTIKTKGKATKAAFVPMSTATFRGQTVRE